MTQDHARRGDSVYCPQHTENLDSITCPACSMTSYNPNDIEWGYCGNCHAYTSPVNPLMKAKRFIEEARHISTPPVIDLGTDG